MILPSANPGRRTRHLRGTDRTRVDRCLAVRSRGRPAGCGVNGGENLAELVVQRGRRIVIALSGQGERGGAVSEAGEAAGHRCPDRSGEPHAGDEHEVHAGNVAVVWTLRVRANPSALTDVFSHKSGLPPVTCSTPQKHAGPVARSRSEIDDCQRR